MRIALLAALAVSSMTVAACGKSGSDAETAQANAAAAAPAPAAADAAADASQVTSIPGYTPSDSGNSAASAQP